MNIIKNIHKVRSITTTEAIEKLEFGAKLYQRHSRIEFKILSEDSGVVTIRTTQSKSPAENYLTQTDLIQRTKDLFGPAFTGRDIHVHAVIYSPSPVDEVDVVWIKDKMNLHKRGLKDLVKDTGIDKASLSAIINEHVGLSQSMKGMFYYYFLSITIKAVHEVSLINNVSHSLLEKKEMKSLSNLKESIIKLK